MSIFGAVEERFQADRRRGALDTALCRWRVRHPCLGFAHDVDDLVEIGRSGVKQVKESALAAICREAADGDEEARLTLAWLLLPALLRSGRSLAVTTTLELDDLYGEMLLGFFSEVPNVRSDDRNVSGRLLNRARWRAIEVSREALERQLREAPESEPDHDEHDATTIEDWESRVEWEADGWELDATLIVGRAVAQGLITSQDAEVVMTDRRTSPELCRRLGISAFALQCRRHRIRLRLRAWFRETFPDVIGA